MGNVIPMKRKRAPKPTPTPPRPAAALAIDAAAMLQSYEMARKGVAQLATSSLMRNVHRTWPYYQAAADLVRASRTLGIIK